MESFPILIIPFFFIGVGLVIRLLAGTLERSRIRNYIEGQGGVLLSCAWSPFATGWFGSKNERLYTITYNDSYGTLHQAVCKTSMLASVYFTDDSPSDR